MNKEEKTLTDYLHSIIENNMSLRKENDRLWKQKLEYIEKISKAIEYIKNENLRIVDISKEISELCEKELLEILGGKE